jgi:2-dehydro-3-deoxyphosphooctonate aldolase (KDO 8-P synthase)
MAKIITIGTADIDQVKIYAAGGPAELFLIAGPCVIESKDICFTIAQRLKTLTGKLGIGYIFKASFDKANRTSGSSFRGPGLEKGLAILQEVRQKFSVPVVSDIHLPSQAKACAEVLDILQIPAFLSRQTDLLEAAGRTNKCVQVKKAQFAAPWDMKNIVDKILAQGNDNITLVERGSSFGYNRLICDMCAIPQMRQLGYPVIIDATHSTQQPGGLGNASGGNPQMAHVLAKAAIASGADGLFIETHPEPAKALSDAACMLPLNEVEDLLKICRDIYHCVRSD